jgi:8-oxo-dGTP diphosphatase
MIKKNKYITVILPYAKNQESVFMQLRDNNPTIESPSHWGYFGGEIEDNESEEECARRELYEEIGYETKNLVYLGYENLKDLPHIYVHSYTFLTDINLIEFVNLQEGMDCKFVKYNEIKLSLIYSNKLNKNFPIVKTDFIDSIFKKTIDYWSKQ